MMRLARGAKVPRTGCSATAATDANRAGRHKSAKKPLILVVDPAPYMRHLLHLHFVNAGYRVALAEDAIAAGHGLLKEPPDLIVMESRLPYLSGLDFFAALRADETIPNIPVIFLTSDELAEFRARQLGAAAFLTKPARSDRLLDLAERYVNP